MKTFKTSLTALAILTTTAFVTFSCKENDDEAVGIVPQVTTADAQYVTYNSAYLEGSVTSDGGSEIIAKGFCYGTNPNPTIEGDTTNQGEGSDSFQTDIDELIPGTTYYARAYATNSTGTNYGEEVTFTTQNGFPELTVEMGGIYFTKARATLSISWEGASPILGSGIVYSSENPVPTNMDIMWPSNSTASVVERQLTELEPGTTYYVRAYATNSQGTQYSDVAAFTTKSDAPVTDVDGNVYEMKIIGDQAWMTENLRVTKYNNGDAIATTLADVSGETDPKYQWVYSNDANYAPTYGRYYTYFAMMDSRKVCPAGTRLPTAAEMNALVETIGMDGGKYKLTGTSTWKTPNIGATNSSGFNAPGAGFRNQYGAYTSFQEVTFFLTETENTNDNTRINGFHLIYDFQNVVRTDTYIKKSGYSVRCVVD